MGDTLLLRKRARPGDYLLQNEMGREDEYLLLYEQQLACVARGCEPTEADVILARVTTSRLWALGRESADANAIHRNVVKAPYFEGRRNLHLELSDRGTVQRKVFEQIRELLEMADQMRDRQLSLDSGARNPKPQLKVVGG